MGPLALDEGVVFSRELSKRVFLQTGVRATYRCRQHLGTGRFLFLRGPKGRLEEALNLFNNSSDALAITVPHLQGRIPRGAPNPWTTTEREQHRASLPPDGVIEHRLIVAPRTPPREHRKGEEGTRVSEAPDTSTTRSSGEPTPVSGLARALTDSGVATYTKPHKEMRTSLWYG